MNSMIISLTQNFFFKKNCIFIKYTLYFNNIYAPFLNLN